MRDLRLHVLTAAGGGVRSGKLALVPPRDGDTGLEAASAKSHMGCYGASVTKWEYAFVDLYRGEVVEGYDAFADLKSEIEALGADGWEAVGEVRLAFDQKTEPAMSSGKPGGNVAILMFKRPLIA